MDIIDTTVKEAAFIKCKKCGMGIYFNTHKRMTPCTCGAIQVDGCEYYFRMIGNKEDYELVHK